MMSQSNDPRGPLIIPPPTLIPTFPDTSTRPKLRWTPFGEFLGYWGGVPSWAGPASFVFLLARRWGPGHFWSGVARNDPFVGSGRPTNDPVQSHITEALHGGRFKCQCNLLLQLENTLIKMNFKNKVTRITSDTVKPPWLQN